MKKLALTVGVLVAIGGAAVVWTSVTDTPPSMDMAPPDSAAMAEGAPIVDVSLPAELSPQAQIGKRAFEAKCASCHGADAAGQNGAGPPLVHKIYAPGHHSDMAFVLAARQGVRAHHWKFGDMPPVDGLTDGEVKYIAGYVRELQNENGID